MAAQTDWRCCGSVGEGAVWHALNKTMDKVVAKTAVILVMLGVLFRKVKIH